jgi:hypothetical protein
MGSSFLNMVYPSEMSFPSSDAPDASEAPIQGPSSYDYDMIQPMIYHGFPTVFDNTPLPPGSNLLAHDDMCIEHCTGIGVHNGANNFQHRGAHASMLFRNSSISVIPPKAWTLDAQFPQSQNSWQQDMDSCRNQAMARGDAGNVRSSISPPYGLAPTATDNDQSSCCTSECDLTDKCTDAACENESDICHDRNCPDRPDKTDQDEAVSTLLSIQNNQGQTFPGVSQPRKGSKLK